MKEFFSKPQNIRIFREYGIASIIVFLLLGFVGPFHVNELDNTRFLYFFLIALTVFVVGCLTGLFTCYVLKMPLDPSLPLHTVHRNAVMIYLIHLPFTAAVITTVFGIMYCDHASDIWWYDGHINWIPYFHYLYYVVSLGFFICLGTFVRNRNWHLRYELEEMKNINALLEQNQEEGEQEEPQGGKKNNNHPCTIKEDDEENESTSQNSEECPCRFEGYTASSTLEVLPSHIIYIESMANYADVWYLDNNKPSHKLLRITLKQVKSTLESIPFFAQCHRAFIVNLQFVVTMTNRNNAYQLQIFGTDKQIPVSRSYTPEIKRKLQIWNSTERK